jgi:hypothetical protein
MNVSSKYALVAPVAACLALAVGACGSGGDGTQATADPAPAGSTGSSLPTGSEPVNLDPSQFTTRIDNPYFPMKPGTRRVFREVESGQTNKVVVTVTNRTKRIANGITARVVHDVVSTSGKPVERTFDWYAQDSEGNLWYMGEDTKEFKNGKVLTEGSWEAGVNGAQPGVAIPADPQPGMSYRQEYYKGHAEDQGRVLSLDGKATVPAGSYRNLLVTKDYTPLEPNFVEHKYYAKGVGEVQTILVSGGKSHEVLLSYGR